MPFRTFGDHIFEWSQHDVKKKGRKGRKEKKKKKRRGGRKRRK